MIPHTLRITLCVAVICYFIIILYYLKNKMLDLKYTLLWLLAGLIMAVMIFFPQVLIGFIGLLGIQSNMNGLFILLFAFTLMLLMMLTAIASRTSMKIRTLIQENAMMDKRIRELEKNLQDKKDDEEA